MRSSLVVRASDCQCTISIPASVGTVEWNLRGGRWSSAEYSTKNLKSPKKYFFLNTASRKETPSPLPGWEWRTVAACFSLPRTKVVITGALVGLQRGLRAGQGEGGRGGKLAISCIREYHPATLEMSVTSVKGVAKFVASPPVSAAPLKFQFQQLSKTQ